MKTLRLYTIRFLYTGRSWKTTDSMEAAQFVEMFGYANTTLFSEVYEGEAFNLQPAY